MYVFKMGFSPLWNGTSKKFYKPWRLKPFTGSMGTPFFPHGMLLYLSLLFTQYCFFPSVTYATQKHKQLVVEKISVPTALS